MRQRARVIYGAKAGESDAGGWFDGRHARKVGEGIGSMRFIVASSAETAAFDSFTVARISSGLMCTSAEGMTAWGGPLGAARLGSARGARRSAYRCIERGLESNLSAKSGQLRTADKVRKAKSSSTSSC